MRGQLCQFVTKKAANLPGNLKDAFPPGFTEARVIEGALAKHTFQGTIDEIRPTLTKEAMRSGLPAILVDDAGTRFSMVVTQPKAVTCPLAGAARRGCSSLPSYSYARRGEVSPARSE